MKGRKGDGRRGDAPGLVTLDYWPSDPTCQPVLRRPVTLWAHYWGPGDSSPVLLHSRRVVRTLPGPLVPSPSTHLLRGNSSQPEALLSGYVGSEPGTPSASQTAGVGCSLEGVWATGETFTSRGDGLKTSPRLGRTLKHPSSGEPWCPRRCLCAKSRERVNARDLWPRACRQVSGFRLRTGAGQSLPEGVFPSFQ